MPESKLNKEAFENLYKNYYSQICYTSYKILHDWSLAEDAAQDVFLRLLEPELLNRLEHMKNKGAYLNKIAVNISINMKSSKKTAHFLFLDEQELDLFYTIDNVNEVIERLSLNELLYTINKLPDIYKDVLILRYIHELSSEEISNVLQINSSMVRKRLERGRRKLRVQYELDFTDSLDELS